MPLQSTTAYKILKIDIWIQLCFLILGCILVLLDLLWAKEGFFYLFYLVVGLPQFFSSLIYWCFKDLQTWFLKAYSCLLYPICFAIILSLTGIKDALELLVDVAIAGITIGPILGFAFVVFHFMLKKRLVQNCKICIIKERQGHKKSLPRLGGTLNQ